MVADRHTELVCRVEEAAVRAARDEGVELVEVFLRGSSRKRLVRADIDRPGPTGVTHDDCKRVSGALGRILDEEEVLPGSYVLEVSSPGADRPIESADDVRRNTGRRIVVTTDEPIAGAREFHGILTGGSAGALTVQQEDHDPVEIPFDRVVKAQQDTGF